MLPLLVVFPISFSSAPYLQFPPPGFSLAVVRALSRRSAMDRCHLCARSRSARATAVLALALGVPLAFGLARGRFAAARCSTHWRWRRSSCRPSSSRSRVYGLFAKLKLIGEWYGLAVAHTVLALPFVVMVMVAGLRDFDRALEQAARGAGRQPPGGRCCASPCRCCGRAWSRPALLAFISSFDELVVALFLAGANMTLAQEDVRQHPDGDRSDHRRGVGDADRAGLDRAGPDRPLRPRACSGSAR